MREISFGKTEKTQISPVKRKKTENVEQKGVDQAMDAAPAQPKTTPSKKSANPSSRKADV